jgi:hypothetical protein
MERPSPMSTSPARSAWGGGVVDAVAVFDGVGRASGAPVQPAIMSIPSATVAAMAEPFRMLRRTIPRPDPRGTTPELLATESPPLIGSTVI